jgi:hypothetical protein
MPTTRPEPQGRLYDFASLPLKGIKFHPNHIRRLVRAKRFPAPIYLSPRRPCWTESALDAWLMDLEAERDAKTPRP